MLGGEGSMKVRWERVLFVAGVSMLIATYLWLRQNSHKVRYKWSSFVRGLTDFSGSEILQFCFYIALGIGVIITVLWLASCVTKWFRR